MAMNHPLELRSSRLLPRIAYAAAAALLLGALLWSSNEGANPHIHAGSLRDLARGLQQQTHFEFQSLKERGQSLGQVLTTSTVVGVGRIVDIREGYRVDVGPLTDGGRAYERHMLIVIEPERLLKGGGNLGSSGLVYVSRPWSPAYPLERMRAALSGAAQKVAFFLTPAQLDLGAGLVDEFAGRQQDDRLFWPTQASTLLGVDMQQRIAFPLMTDELLETSKQNKDPLARAGVSVQGFTTVKVHVEPDIDESNPGEPEVPEQ
jgi:hypothetical protein